MKACGTYIFGGLFSQGVKDAGHEIVAHIEDGEFGIETSKMNFPGMPHFSRRTYWPKAMLREMDIDFMYGNPPCAGYSMASKIQGADNPMNDGLSRANALGWAVKPKAFAVESVLQMFNTGDERVRGWEYEWHKLGYNTCRLVENAGHLGLAQERKRALFVAARANLNFKYENIRRAATVREAIGDLVNVPVTLKGTDKNEPQPYAQFATTAFQAYARRGSPQVTWHCYQKMNKALASLIPYLEPGQRVRSIADEIYKETYWKISPNHQGGKPSFLVARLDWDKPSAVITGAASYIHPEFDRFITVRETARLMGLPDSFEFSNEATAYAELGKAVSPYVGHWLSNEVAEILQDPYGREHKSTVRLL